MARTASSSMRSDVAFGDQRGPLRRQHLAVERREHLGAQRVCLGVGHLVGVLGMPGDRAA